MPNAAPDIRLQIKRPFSNRQGDKSYWAPIGDISLWRGEDGKFSGTCRIYFFGFELRVYESEYAGREEG